MLISINSMVSPKKGRVTFVCQSLEVVEDIGEGGELLLVLEQLGEVLHGVGLSIRAGRY